MSDTFEILSRGRCPFGGVVWYEGDVRFHRNGDVTITPKGGVDGIGFFVDPETVTTYVQRIDKNGKHVFDGDICRCTGVENGEAWEDCFFVGFDSENCSFSIDGRDGEFLPSSETFAREIEVIGNKFDDPKMYETLYNRAHGKAVQ